MTTACHLIEPARLGGSEKVPRPSIACKELTKAAGLAACWPPKNWPGFGKGHSRVDLIFDINAGNELCSN